MLTVLTSFFFMALAAACGSTTKVDTRPDPLERIPADWIDLPEAPFVADVRAGKAVLVNRTQDSFNRVTAGCVVRQGVSARVVGQLFSVDISDSVWGPGREVEGLLRDVNNIDYYVASQERLGGRKELIKPCPPGASTAVTGAALRGRHMWVAEGTKWSR